MDGRYISASVLRSNREVPHFFFFSVFQLVMDGEGE